MLAEAKSEAKSYAHVPTAANANSNSVNQAPPNTNTWLRRWDAMLAYEQKSWAARSTSRTSSTGSTRDQGGFAIPGAGRAIILTGEYKF